MKREDRKKYNNYSLFTFDEMLNQKLDRWESNALNGRTGPSLIYSLVIDMFRFIGDTRDEKEILDECRYEKEWYDKYLWTIEQHDEWRTKHLIPVIKKRMRLSKDRAERESSWFMLQWSFRIDEDKNTSND